MDLLPAKIDEEGQAQRVAPGLHLHFAEAGVAKESGDGVGAAQPKDDVGECGGLGADVARYS